MFTAKNLKIIKIICAATVVLVLLSIMSVANQYSSIGLQTIFALIGGLIVYGVSMIAGKLFPDGAKKVIAIIILLILGILAFLQATPQLSTLGFAASNRNPNPGGALLAYMGAGIALWQVFAITRSCELPKKLTVSYLIAINLFLVFASIYV